MKKREVVALLSSVALSTTLAACGNQSEMLQMLKNGDQIEIEVAMPEHMKAEQGTEQAAQWIELGKLDTNTIIRNDWDSIMLITKTADGKNGIIYVTEDGKCTQNNTLYVALHNREFQKMFESQDSMDKLAQSVFEQYADLDASIEKSDINIAVWMGVNGYFNLIPDNEVNMANANSPITRGESLALVYRANNEVQELTPDEVFAQAVGDSTFNIYAQNIQSNGYLTTEQGALNPTTYNGTVTRAEFIYLLVNTYYADELASVDVKGVNLSDAKDGGDIAGKQQYDKSLDYWKSYELKYAIDNPDGGLPTDLYRALVVAKELNLIGSTTRWDEAITKAEAIEMLCQAIMHDGKEVFSYKLGEISGYEAPVTEVEDNTTNIGDGNESFEGFYDEDETEEVSDDTSEDTTTSEDDGLHDADGNFKLDDWWLTELKRLGATDEEIASVKSEKQLEALVNRLYSEGRTEATKCDSCYNGDGCYDGSCYTPTCDTECFTCDACDSCDNCFEDGSCYQGNGCPTWLGCTSMVME